MRYMPRLRLPDFGSRVVTQGSVMNRPASLGQHCRIGKSSSEKLSRLITSLQGPVGTVAGKKLSRLRQQGQHLELVEKTLRRLHIHEHPDAVRDFVERINAERELHARLGAELIDQDLRAGMALDVLEEKSRTARDPLASRLLETRSVISAISRIGSVSVWMRFSWPARSSAAIHWRRSSKGKEFLSVTDDYKGFDAEDFLPRIRGSSRILESSWTRRILLTTAAE